MNIFKPFSTFFIRLRYPVSLPEDVASDLGFELSNSIQFNDFIRFLTDPSHRPTNLSRLMPRGQAEDVFRLARRKEKFSKISLFSYHFNGGWMEFILEFDEQALLRRLYIRHKDLKQKHEISISS